MIGITRQLFVKLLYISCLVVVIIVLRKTNVYFTEFTLLIDRSILLKGFFLNRKRMNELFSNTQ